MEFRGLDPADARRILEEEGENLLPQERAQHFFRKFLSLMEWSGWLWGGIPAPVWIYFSGQKKGEAPKTPSPQHKPTYC
ncbi:MAG: hypothetical protein M1537_02890, partial [Nitrospirae bacterium]|nr:hypothetical protein [Nitrospirota bacterium]